MPQFFMLKVEKSNVLLELKINGVPLVLSSNQAKIDTSETLNIWIKPGKNLLSVYLTWPNDLAYQPGLAQCKLHLEALAEGEKAGMGHSLAAFVWPLVAEALGHTKKGASSVAPAAPTEYYPYEARLNFTVNPVEAPPSRVWKEAQPITWNDKEKKAVIQRLMLLHKALDQKDLPSVVKFLDFKAVDSGGAHYMAPDKARQSQQEFFEFLFSLEDWGMAPIEPANLDFHLLADDRILLISESGMKPVLRSTNPTGPRFLLPVYFALIQGIWLIVR